MRFLFSHANELANETGIERCSTYGWRALVEWMNARSGDILIRSLGGPDLRMIASFDADGVDNLTSLGLAPATTSKRGLDDLKHC